MTRKQRPRSVRKQWKPVAIMHVGSCTGSQESFIVCSTNPRNTPYPVETLHALSQRICLRDASAGWEPFAKGTWPACMSFKRSTSNNKDTQLFLFHFRLGSPGTSSSWLHKYPAGTRYESLFPNSSRTCRSSSLSSLGDSADPLSSTGRLSDTYNEARVNTIWPAGSARICLYACSGEGAGRAWQRCCWSSSLISMTCTGILCFKTKQQVVKEAFLTIVMECKTLPGKKKPSAFLANRPKRASFFFQSSFM